MDNSQKKISMNVIRRLPKYHSYLIELMEKGIVKVSSKELSDITGFTASQIRQDLNNFGGFGKQGSGYEVESLLNEISDILGINTHYNAVIIGAGNLGQAIANYNGFRKYALDIKAIFDVNPRLIGMKIHSIDVLDIDMATNFINDNNIQIAIICTPKEAVKKIALMLEKTNIKGVWNFAPADFSVNKDIKVENVNLSDSLFVLSYMISQNEKEDIWNLF